MSQTAGATDGAASGQTAIKGKEKYRHRISLIRMIIELLKSVRFDIFEVIFLFLRGKAHSLCTWRSRFTDFEFYIPANSNSSFLTKDLKSNFSQVKTPKCSAASAASGHARQQ